MRTSRVFAAFCAAAWAGLTFAVTATAAVAPAAPAPPQQTFGGSTDVVEVEVPVQVIRDGQPVRGLKAEDFEVYDGRTRQALTGFHAVDLAAPAAQRAAAVPLAGRRQFLLFFDLAFSDPKSVVKAREAARELVIKGLRPGDLVGVATYSAARGPQIVLGLTSDRRQVDSALSSLGTVHPDRADDPLRLVMGHGNGGTRPGQISEHSQEADAAHTDALFTELGTQQATLNRDANRSAQKASITALTRAYSDMARTLAAIPGRKQVVYFSEGFDSTLITGTVASFNDRPEESPVLGQIQQPGVGSSEAHLENSDDTFGNTQAINALEKMLEELRRADCVIQAVDLGGLRAGGEQQVTRTAGKESLFAMARGTGGELFEGSNDLSSAMSGMMQRTSLTYVLTFQPDKVKPDGTYHKLRVELKNAPRGTRVAFRPGWYAPRPYRQLNPMEKLFEASSKLMGGAESGSIPSAVLAAPFRATGTDGSGAGDRAYVPVLIEVDGPALLADKPQGVLPVEVYVYALGADGAIQDFLFQALGLDLAKAETALRQGGLKFFGHLDLPAGEYSVRTLIRNGASGAYSLRAVPLTVPAFATAGPVLLPPLFPDATANRWLIIREAQRGAQVAYPFMARKQPFVPSTRPALAAGQEIPVALLGYNLAAGDLKAEARVTTPDGKEAGTEGGGVLRVLDREKGGGGAPDRLTATFRPPKLPPGEYLLRVTLTGDGAAAGPSSAPFVVGGGR
ncbi:MAG TPA: VWA domain-containing protein [Thermoanaerobaculia bacterium]|jgi:VWFA-related protein|nr:VWA domain-containing protein [Thermoanaerobaculia bacterium]